MEYNRIKPAGRYVPSEKIRLLPYGRFYENQERTLNYLRELDCERMLYNFRRAFGADTRGAQPLGGWEEPDGLLRGHSTGHFLSALSLAYASTGEELFREKLGYIVHELRSLQLMSGGDPAAFVTACSPGDVLPEKWSVDPSEWGEGYISAYSPDQFAMLEKLIKYKDIWAPYYTLHKIVAGLLECYTRAGVSEALTVAEGIGGWIYARLGAVPPERRREMWDLYIAGEFGGMNESMARLYDLTGNEKYLAAARMFDNENVFPALAEGRDAVANRHANQHIPQMIGAWREYLALGDGFYAKVAENFFKIVAAHHMYSIGGVGRAESFQEPDALAANIEGDANCETCAAYNLLKLARELYAADPGEAAYMDYCERALVNQILASQNPQSQPDMLSGVTYMLPIGPGAKRSYSDNYNSFTCCHGTGMENHVKYTDFSFLEAGDRLYINQYIGLETTDGAVRIETDFPFQNVKISLRPERDTEFWLRIPAWCDNPFPTLKKIGRYAVLRLMAGERTELCGSFDYSPRWEKTQDRLDGAVVAALMYGPFVMVVEDSREDWLLLDPDLSVYKAVSDAELPTLTDGERLFIPMYAAAESRYHAYFKLS